MNNFVSWQDVFTDEGILHPGAKDIIFASRSLYEHVASGSLQHPAAVLVWQHEHMKNLIFDSNNIEPKLTEYFSKLNGTAREHQFSGIILPKKHDQLSEFKKGIRRFYQESQMESPLGVHVLEKLREKKIDFSFILNLLPEIKFYHLVGKENGKMKFGDVPASHKGAGIYILREYALGDILGTTVYVGMSVSWFLKTIKAHFYPHKPHPGYDHPCGRGEDRGEWIQKLDAGYRYSVGILPIKPEEPKDYFWKDVKKLETKFIQALCPRDNESERPCDDHPTLFNKSGTPNVPDDDPVSGGDDDHLF